MYPHAIGQFGDVKYRVLCGLLTSIEWCSTAPSWPGTARRRRLSGHVGEFTPATKTRGHHQTGHFRLR
jgi:hypothetical protein